MVAIDNMCNRLVTVSACIVTLLTLAVQAEVFEVKKATFDKWLKNKFFALTFVDSPSCTRCRSLYPFFVMASQVFHNDPEIFMARTMDKALVKEWDVKELPALVYHLHGKNKPYHLPIDITVDDIIDMIARLLHGNFAAMKRSYTLTITADNWQEMIVTPRQSVLLLIHDRDTDKEKKAFEKVAYAFRKDHAIMFASLNADQQEKLRDEKFKTRDVPTVMWFSANAKDSPKRFGGVLSPELITMFVNERTGLNRDMEGGILEDAGRVPEADAILEANLADFISAKADPLNNIARKLSALKNKLEEHQAEMIEFYLFVIENVSMSGNVAMIRELVNGEEEKLSEKDELATKERETLKRRRNILRYMQKLVKKSKTKKKANVEEEILVVDAVDHRHTEL